MYKLILASQSPRRKELLEKQGVLFEALPVEVSETSDKNLNIDEQILEIAQRKARACMERHKHLKFKDYLILSADTLVILENEAIGKPKNSTEAEITLARLSGRWHEVKTGVFLINCKTFEQAGFVETSRVSFRALSQQDIADYVASGEPMDKAGAYGIQGEAKKFVDKIEGVYENIVGLPVQRLMMFLENKKWAIEFR